MAKEIPDLPDLLSTSVTVVLKMVLKWDKEIADILGH